jgi:hypothetical protein
MQVRHGEREIEITAFAGWLHDQALPSLATTLRGSGPAAFGTRSSELLAGQITDQIAGDGGAV